MKERLKQLWHEYLLDECAAMDTDEERTLIKKIIELHAKATAPLNEEQAYAVEKYVDALHDMETLFSQKAFLKGCEFTASFLLEVGFF